MTERQSSFKDHSIESQRLLLNLQQLNLRATLNVQARLKSRKFVSATSENRHLRGSLHLFKGCYALFLHSHQCLERSQNVHQTLNDVMQVKARPTNAYTNILGHLPSICWSFGLNFMYWKLQGSRDTRRTSRVHPTIAC